MAVELGMQQDQENVRNGLQFFDRADDLTVSNVGLAAREGDEERLIRLIADGESLHSIPFELLHDTYLYIFKWTAVAFRSQSQAGESYRLILLVYFGPSVFFHVSNCTSLNVTMNWETSKT